MRHFSARETEWLEELDGIELAGFTRRALAFIIDWTLISVVMSVVVGGSLFALIKYREAHGHPLPKNTHFDMRPQAFKLESDDTQLEKYVDTEWVHLVIDIAVPVFYFGLFTWRGKGRTPGKRIMRIRVVSLVHRHLSLWHSVERALGYGAAALEAGFGFIQFFIHPYRRCVQDRIAETIVVTERSYRSMQHKFAHPLLPGNSHQPASRLADEALIPEP